MSFYRNRVYPHLVSRLGDPEPIRAVRQRIIPMAAGVVLEIGIGSGTNFAHYDPDRIKKLYALEPNPGMIQLAKRHLLKTGLRVEFLDLQAERIPLADGTIDTVVSTFTLGMIAGVEEAIRGIRRVVRPGGRLIFFELTRSDDPAIQRWQQRWEPIMHRLYAGLHLTQNIPTLLTDGGFQIEQLQTAYLTSFPRSWAYACWGVACR
jgi:ubiquinone/menaquinone biosynthesis C-methylase UbiE